MNNSCKKKSNKTHSLINFADCCGALKKSSD
jgi:hypothetical protein